MGTQQTKIQHQQSQSIERAPPPPAPKKPVIIQEKQKTTFIKTEPEEITTPESQSVALRNPEYVRDLKLGKKSRTIVHIDGPPGSGRTSLFNKISNVLRGNMEVKIIYLTAALAQFDGRRRLEEDDTFYPEKYQQFLDTKLKSVVNENSVVKIIIVCGGGDEGRSDTFYEIKDVDYKYYIDVSSVNMNDVIANHFKTEFKKWVDSLNETTFFAQIQSDEQQAFEKFCAKTKNQMSISKMRKYIQTMNNLYIEHNYVLLPLNDIFEQVVAIVVAFNKNYKTPTFE